MKVYKQESSVGDNSTRIVWVDYYKAVGIFLIVLGHVSFTPPLNEMTNFLFLFHVPLFFFISGYLEKKEKCDAKKYLFKLFKSLIIPYIIWNVMFISYHFPVSLKDCFAVLSGVTLWNGASWFLMVLFFLKLSALLFKNKKFVMAIFFSLFFFSLMLYGKKLPFLINITFLFYPFFFAGTYGKKVIDCIVSVAIHKLATNVIFALFMFFLLICLYNFSPIAHTHAVIDFIPQFYLFWISGFLGITLVFFLCLCLNAKRNQVVTMISSGTLFIMCSHYEFVHYVSKDYLSPLYGNIVSIVFVCLYFILQCVCVPVVLKYVPILAGRKTNYKIKLFEQ